jgi:hypothetical protein
VRKTSSSALLNNLDRAITTAVMKAVSDKSLLFSNDSTVVIGNMVIKKDDDLYKVMNHGMDTVHYVTRFIDNAIYIAHQHQFFKYDSIRKLLRLEKSYLKHDTDMKFYLHSYKLARTSDDEYKRNSLEDRYYLSREERARAKMEMKYVTKSFSKRINTRKYS